MLRVASVPGSHIYVRHLSAPDGGDTVVRLDDPVPPDGRTVPGGWWPPLMLEPGWVSANHDRFDVFHVHFGFDAVSHDELAEVVHELAIHHKPLVYTVHDLRNPHHAQAQSHAAHQEVLIAAADELITLTDGAAKAIRQRWGRDVHTQPHPHVLEADRLERPRRREERFVVGLHAKSLRANMDPLPVLDALVPVVSALPDAVLQINVHDEIFDPANYWFAPQTGHAILSYQRHDHVRVDVHPYFADSQLWEYLASLTVSVLPYRFGTHSGWLEACHDLGTAVIVPSCGFYAEQQPCGVFEFTEDRFDEVSLQLAVEDAYRRWISGAPAPRAHWPIRRVQRSALAVAHRQLYESVLQ